MANKRDRLDKRSLVILGAVLGVQAVLCAGLAMSVHTKKAGMEQTLSGKETALSNVRTVSAGLPGLQAQYEKMLAQVQFLEKALPQPEYIPTLLGDVERTAMANGVQVQEFRPKVAANNNGAAPAAATSGFAQQQFDLVVSGDYAHIQKFLRSLTRFRKILALNSIKLQPAPGEKSGASPQLSGALALTAFVLPPSASSVPGAPNLPAGNVAESPLAPSAATPAPAKVAARQGSTTPTTAKRG